jgi:S1-C subfamily serine protease
MSNALIDFSNEIADVVEQAATAAVRVEGRRRLAATGIVWREQGLVITADHVVKRDDNIRIGFASGRVSNAELVGRDPTTDLALLRVDDGLGESLEWSEDINLKVGHIVLALGRPGEKIQATMGVVSAIGPSWRTPAGGELSQYVQTDVVMYPGFSGGPLVSASGEFIGMNTSRLVRGVSMTISSESLNAIANDLIEHGQVRRGYLGVSLQIVRLPEKLASELGQRTGLLIAGVEVGSPADKSELYQGDILVNIMDTPIRHMDDLFVQLPGDRIGSKVSLQIIRAGELLNVEVEIGVREG